MLILNTCRALESNRNLLSSHLRMSNILDHRLNSVTMNQEIRKILHDVHYQLGSPESRELLISLTTFIAEDKDGSVRSAENIGLNAITSQSMLASEVLRETATDWLDTASNGSKFWPSIEANSLSYLKNGQL